MNLSVRVTKRQAILLFYSALTVLAIVFSQYFNNFEMTKYVFAFCVITVYLINLPKDLMNPKNIVFFFYFVWYVLATMFGARFSSNKMASYGAVVNIAFFMCFVVYLTAMLTLEFFSVDDSRFKNAINFIRGQSMPSKLVTLTLLVIGWYFFIQHTGGLSLWINDAYTAQFSKRGSGQYFLVYSMSFLVFAFFLGQETSKKRLLINRTLILCLLVLNYKMLGSKLTVITILMLIFADILLNAKLISKWTVFLTICGIVVFISGLVVRMGSLDFALSYSLDYFDTFENFGKLLRDYSPAFLTTFLMPFLWPFIKLGLTNQEFYDINVWLTAQYTPDTWYVGQGSNQWNMETDMYLNYHFWGGIPLVVLYFAIIAFLYNRAKTVGGVWKFIYIYEATLILSHLRGGLFIFWYWYLIPLYAWLIIKYAPDAKIRMKSCRKDVI